MSLIFLVSLETSGTVCPRLKQAYRETVLSLVRADLHGNRNGHRMGKQAGQSTTGIGVGAERRGYRALAEHDRTHIYWSLCPRLEQTSWETARFVGHGAGMLICLQWNFIWLLIRMKNWNSHWKCIEVERITLNDAVHTLKDKPQMIPLISRY